MTITVNIKKELLSKAIGQIRNMYVVIENKKSQKVLSNLKKDLKKCKIGLRATKDGELFWILKVSRSQNKIGEL